MSFLFAQITDGAACRRVFYKNQFVVSVQRIDSSGEARFFSCQAGQDDCWGVNSLKKTAKAAVAVARRQRAREHHLITSGLEILNPFRKR